METTGEDHEQAVVTSSSSPNSMIDTLDSRSHKAYRTIDQHRRLFV